MPGRAGLKVSQGFYLWLCFLHPVFSEVADSQIKSYFDSGRDRLVLVTAIKVTSSGDRPDRRQAWAIRFCTASRLALISALPPSLLHHQVDQFSGNIDGIDNLFAFDMRFDLRTLEASFLASSSVMETETGKRSRSLPLTWITRVTCSTWTSSSLQAGHF